MRKLLLTACIGLLFNGSSVAQTLLHSADFSSGLGGYSTSSTTSIVVSGTSPSSGYAFASGGNNVLFQNNFTGSDTLYSPTISTVGFQNIKIQFGQIRGGVALIRSLLFFDGTTWQAGPGITGVTGSWAATDSLTLGTPADENPNFRFAIVVTTVNNPARTLRFDDFRVFGTPVSATTYYSKSTGALNVLGTWGTNTDGTGTSPMDFTTAGITYVVRNNSSPTLTGNWIISGIDSRITVQNGINFTIPASFTYSGTIDVEAGGTVTANNATTSGITFDDLSATSKVIYNAGAVRPAIYGDFEVNANVFLAGNMRAVGFSEFGDYLNLNGFTAIFEQSVGGIAVEGTATSNLEISGPGVINDLLIGASDFNNVTINKPGGVISLDAFLAINGTLAIQEGDLNLSSLAGLTIRSTGNITYGISSRLRAGVNSTINLQAGSGSAGELRFRPGFDTVQQLIVTRTASLGSNLVVTGNCIFNGGAYSFNIGANSITTVGFTGIGISNIATTSSSSLTLRGPATTYTLPSVISQLNNFTLNRPSGVCRQSGPLTVHGAFNINAGAFQPQTNTLTLRGSTFVAGTGASVLFTSATVVYDQPTAGQTIIRTNYRSLVLNNQNKVFPSGSYNIGVLFNGGTSRGHTTTGTTINFTNTGSQTIPGFNYNNVNSNNGGARTVPSGDTVIIAGTFNPGTSTFTTSGSAFAFTGASQTINSNSTFSYHHLVCAGTGTKTLGTNIRCTGNLTVSSGTSLNTSDFSIDLGGNFVRNGGLTLGNTVIMVNGAAKQTFFGFFSVRDLVMSNTSDTSLVIHPGVSDSIRISRQLIVLPGTGFLQTSNKLILQDGARIVDSASTVGPQGSVLGNVIIYRTGNSIPGSPILWNQTSSPVRSADALDSVLMSGGFFPRRYVETVVSTDIEQGWENIGGTNLEVGRGYSTARPGTMVWRGQVNNGSYTYPITSTPSGNPSADGWNMIGNPYPSGISTLAFHAANAGKFVGNTLYVWNANVANYAPIDNVADGTINSCQGFFVQAASTTTVNFTNAMRNTTNGALLRSAPSYPFVSVGLKGNKTFADKVKVVFRADATEGHDTHADAYKLWSAGPVELATRSAQQSAYTIQSIPMIAAHRSIALTARVNEAGKYSFTLDAIHGLDDVDVVLEDTQNKTFHTLTADQGYDFTVTEATRTDSRFRLHFMNRQPSAPVDATVLSKPFAYQGYGRTIVVDFGHEPETACTLSLITMTGQKQLTTTVEKGTRLHTLDVSNYPSGTYLIQLQEPKGHTNNLKIILD